MSRYLRQVFAIVVGESTTERDAESDGVLSAGTVEGARLGCKKGVSNEVTYFRGTFKIAAVVLMAFLMFDICDASGKLRVRSSLGERKAKRKKGVDGIGVDIGVMPVARGVDGVGNSGIFEKKYEHGGKTLRGNVVRATCHDTTSPLR